MKNPLHQFGQIKTTRNAFFDKSILLRVYAPENVHFWKHIMDLKQSDNNAKENFFIKKSS